MKGEKRLEERIVYRIMRNSDGAFATGDLRQPWPTQTFYGTRNWESVIEVYAHIERITNWWV